MQGLYRDQGIVLKAIRLGEADRIVTIYTQNHGRVRCVAKGIRKSTSRIGGRLDAFNHVDVQLYAGRGDLDTLTQAELVGRFPRLRESYPAFTAAAAMADTMERSTPEREPNVRLFVLFRGGLLALDAGADDPALIAYAFLAKVASVGGLHPVLTVCVGCGAPERVSFSFGSGGVVCRSCTQRSDPGMRPETADAWSQVIGSEWDDLRRARLDDAVRRELAGLLLGFVQWQMDNRFKAFAMLTGPAPARP